jgi:hypothetical protein
VPALRRRQDIAQAGQFDLGIPPPAGLVPDSFAERHYLALAPVANLDSTVGWSLLILCNAIGTMFQLLDDWERDTADGPGWSLLLDLDRCPPEALPWLGQFVGARIPSGLSDADQRAWIASTDGWKRGTVAAMQGAARATLTGKQRLFLRERDHDPADTPDYAYYLTAISYANETPNPSATEAALLSQKPAGIVLTYIVQTGQSYEQLASRYATYADVLAAYPSYAVLLADEP